MYLHFGCRGSEVHSEVQNSSPDVHCDVLRVQMYSLISVQMYTLMCKEFRCTVDVQRVQMYSLMYKEFRCTV